MPAQLTSGQTLTSGQELKSQNGVFTLAMQTDGNFVLYESLPTRRRALWASNTSGQQGARVIMQDDGNLVVYSNANRALWASGTSGGGGSTLVMQDDGNGVVYAAGGRAVWGSNTARESRRVHFNPRQHGFHFSNNGFVNKIASIPGFGNIETKGRCGGMAYAALDYYFANVPVPAYSSSMFGPAGVPPDGHWLADYIYTRLMNSFFTGSAAKFPSWTLHSDHQTWFFKGVTKWTKEEEFPKLRGQIDSGRPVPLGLVDATNLADVGNENHQVVAYGYDYYPGIGAMTVWVYDNNYPDTDIALSSEAGNPHWNGRSSDPWRGFFVQDYGHTYPPVMTTRPPQPNQAITFNSIIKLNHGSTGRTLHSHPFNYGHPNSSRQQQVTAFDRADDNDLWRVKGPHGQPEDYKAGQPVQHGDTIRLEHILTRRNLHSHGNIPSPVTGQQEVTAFGSNGIGDSNDNWRIEVETGGSWSANKRTRLIHMNTNHALHSHRGHSHPDWTRGQQEVTGFGGRDDNDWWLLLEIR